MRKTIALLVVAAAAAAVAVSSTVGSADAARTPRLDRFGGCSELLRYVKRNASRLVGPYGLGGVIAMPAVPVAEAAPDGAARDDVSTTNVQEAGVDEPDIVKTDGDWIYAIAQGRLFAVDVRGPRPRLAASLPLGDGWNHQLFLHGDRVVVLAAAPYAVPLPAVEDAETSIAPPIGEPKLTITEIDVRDPAGMRVARTLEVDGVYLSARLTGATARIVVTTPPPILPWVAPASSEPAAATAAEAANRRVIARSRLADWLPSYALENRSSGRTRRGSLLGCRDLYRPRAFSGLGTLTVLTLDLDHGIEPVDTDGVLTDGEIVYASERSLYVTTTRWTDPAQTPTPEGVRTAIHSFDASARGRTEYRSTGTVAGYPLSQWSLSEHEGRLRVASTEQPPWWNDTSSGRESESRVTVLEEEGGKLVEVGRVGGIGKGERVYAVRFVGETGYVVTFRQVDPLYVLDLSSPDRPVVRGELKIAGYSAYLHPVGDGLVLGVGQDATGEGRVLGTQVSVFDVSNPARPTRLDRWTRGQGWSEAEWDHHAFLWWPKTRLAVLPVAGSAVGAVGLRVGPAGTLTEVGVVEHAGGAAIRRAVVVGDTLFTLSESGLEASGLAALDSRAWVPFS